MTGATSRVPAMPTMPHMLFAFRLRRLFGLLPRAEFLRPAGDLLLLAARDRKRVLFRRFGDHRAGADIGSIADFHRRHERRIGADESASADVGEVFVEAVVVAGDGAGADVGALAHARV